MALPTILVNSATGSDSAASGAGPATALTGSAASTGATGLVVTLDGAPDLSGVATDGSHVLYLADSTAGARNFGKVTAADNSAKTVTVADAFGPSLAGKSWALGGKRASIGSAASVKLIENNAGAGDALPGWALELQSGHAETIAATVNPRRAGDATSGPITLRGTSGAATMPVVTFANNGDAFVPRANLWVFRDFELQNSNATKTASQAFNVLAHYLTFKNVRCNHGTNKFWKFWHSSGSNHTRVEDCNVQNCAGIGVDIASGSLNLAVDNCVIAGCGSHGVQISANSDVTGLELLGSVIAYNGGDGFNTAGMTNASLTFAWLIRGNVFHGNASDGVEIPQTSSQTAVWERLTVENNRFTFNGGYGLNLGGSGVTDPFLQSKNVVIRNNNFASNSSGAFFPAALATPVNSVTTDPSGGLATAAKDYAGATAGTNFMSPVGKGLGYPAGGTVAVGNDSSSSNYQDIGLGHQDAGGGGGATYVINQITNRILLNAEDY